MLILQPSSTTSRMFATWKGPGQIVEKRSPYSYVVELNEARYRLHANELRRFRARVEDIRIDGCYFGDPYSIPDAELSSLVVDDYLDSSEIVEQQMSTSKIALCAIISDEDKSVKPYTSQQQMQLRDIGRLPLNLTISGKLASSVMISCMNGQIQPLE